MVYKLGGEGFIFEPQMDDYGFLDYGTGAQVVQGYDLGPRFIGMEPSGEPIEKHWSEIYPGYWLSNHGDLYSSRSDKILKPKPLDREGHLGYCLYVGGERKYCYLHRLLAEAFIRNDDPRRNVVRHLNGDVNNNCLENLSWGTQKENIHDTIEQGNAYYLSIEDREKSYAMSRKPTRATNMQTGEVRDYISLNDAVRDLGVQQANAQKVATGQRPHTCGWKFEYIEED